MRTTPIEIKHLELSGKRRVGHTVACRRHHFAQLLRIIAEIRGITLSPIGDFA